MKDLCTWEKGRKAAMLNKRRKMKLRRRRHRATERRMTRSICQQHQKIGKPSIGLSDVRRQIQTFRIGRRKQVHGRRLRYWSGRIASGYARNGKVSTPLPSGQGLRRERVLAVEVRRNIRRSAIRTRRVGVKRTDVVLVCVGLW